MDAYKELCAQVENDFDGFWAGQARANLKWTKPFTQVLDESDAPFYRWFGDGELNVSANCLDVHLTNGNADKTAIIFEADDGKVDRVTYRELLARVCRFANGLAKLGYKKGDRAIIYMPMSIEAVVAMQACARLGVTHSVVFGGFSAKSLQERIGDVGATVVITADEQVRGGKVIPLKPAVEEAIAMGGCEAVSKVIVYRRTGGKIQWTEGRDLWMHDVEAGQPDTCEPVPVNAEHPLFILYTSGSTGKPKGVQHSSAGYLLWALLTVKWTFDARKDDVYWCTADVGWVTGHTYITYGPLAAGLTGRVRGRAHVPERRPLLGHDRAPQGHHLLHRADRHPFADQGRRSHARGPSAQLRPGFAAHPGHGGRADQSRSLDVVSQTDRPRALPHRRHLVADRDRRPHDHAAAGRHAGKPGSCTLPLPGIAAAIVDETGADVEQGNGGFLVIKRPWPAMIRNIWGDPERFKKSYFPSELRGYYLAGDGAQRDADGYFWIMGRIDDVLNVSGHRLGTMEVESALVAHELVAEAAVVGRPDDTTGEAVVAFVVLKRARARGRRGAGHRQAAARLGGQGDRSHRQAKDIRFGDNLPKTRSGKIMRRLLRVVAKGEEITQDVSTLENPAILDQLAKSL